MVEDDDVLRRAKERLGRVLLGKYRLDRVLGVGGMAVVYAATHRNRKRFAVKMLHPELSSRSDLRARFVREGYVANSVDHPAVVSVIDDDADEQGAAFLVMELLDGESFEALLGGELARCPVPAALYAVHELLDALEAAHRKGILHRDVKPANLFATRSGAVKVLDFGIARLRDVTAPIQSTRTGAMLGTPAFMAREQALGETELVDERTDVWAAGATLFTLLTGELVHRGDNARQVMVRAATEPPRDLAEVAPEVPLAVVDIVRRALRPEKHERFESAAAMRDAVRAAHEQLFGAFDAARIRALFEGRFSALASSPTEASPDLASDPPPRPPDEVVSSLASQTVSEPGRAAEVPPRRIRIGPMALGGVAVLGVALLLASLRQKQSELQPKPHLPSAALVTGPPIAPVREEHGVKVSIKTEAPKPVTRDPSNPSPSAASTTSARKPARPARTKPPVAASAAPQKAEKKRENPLLIEIQ
jgi:serine/threonine protein kinase